MYTLCSARPKLVNVKAAQTFRSAVACTPLFPSFSLSALKYTRVYVAARKLLFTVKSRVGRVIKTRFKTAVAGN